jgi:hypothetical protein
MDLESVPDIKDIMPRIKRRILGGVVLVFSGDIGIASGFSHFGGAIAPSHKMSCAGIYP